MSGVFNRYLRIHLQQEAAEAIPLDEAIQHQCVGGTGLGLHLLLSESDGNYDPLGADAPIVFAFAPLAGTAVNTSAKSAVLCKSPLTMRLNEAMISSRFALAGKATGNDALVVQGACSQWSVLLVEPEGVRVEPVPDLPGLSAEEAELAIKSRFGEDWQVAAIGPAGENQVPFASLSHDGRHAGRGGTGAVMGAKRLKALAVRGNLNAGAAHPDKLHAIRNHIKQESLGPATEKYRSTGTLGNLLVFNRMGILPTNNFRDSSDERAQALSAENLFAEERVQRTTCADCMIGCEKRAVDDNGRSTRLEYENIFALGPLLGMWEMGTVIAASRLCDELGMDTISMGGTLAFAMESVQKGLLDIPQLKNLDEGTLLEAITLTARKEGYGQMLAMGSRALAEVVGKGSQAFAPHVKGLELPGYHPKGLQTLGLGLAVGARGADHNKSGAYDLDLSGKVNRFGLDEERIEEMIDLEDQAAIIDSLILCKFIRRTMDDLYEEGARMLRALTGHAFSGTDMREAAKRIHHMKKLFNQRQGWQSSEDTLPGRFFSDAADSPRLQDEDEASSGPVGLNREQFLKARARYYTLRGWDEDGRLQKRFIVGEHPHPPGVLRGETPRTPGVLRGEPPRTPSPKGEGRLLFGQAPKRRLPRGTHPSQGRKIN